MKPLPEIYLFHWNENEALELVLKFEAAGYSVRHESSDGARGCRDIKDNPPDVIVVYLTRLPSHGSRVGEHLQEVKKTRDIPVIYVGGEKEKVAQVKTRVPTARFSTDKKILSDLGNCLQS
ncbi:MAG TPA: hypothetical protein VGB30_09025 [bacterium]|jgi:hypothetical protein